MKRIVLVLMLGSLFISQNSIAQKGLGIGLGGGVNTVWILNQNAYGEPELDYKLKWGTEGHISVGYNFLPFLGVSTGIGLMKMGQDYEDNINNSKITRVVDLLYTNVPLLVALNAGGDKVKAHLLIGPNFGFLKNATQDYKKDDITYPGNVKTKPTEKIAENKIKNRYNKNCTMLLVDIGADYYVSESLFISLGLRVNYGLTKDINANDWHTPNINNVYTASKNAAAGITLGVNYLLRKD